MAYIKRAAEGTIAQVSKMFPVLLVTGPRQVVSGLSTCWDSLMRKSIRNQASHSGQILNT